MKRIIAGFVFLSFIGLMGCASDSTSDDPNETPITPEPASVNTLYVDGVQIIGQPTTSALQVFHRDDHILIATGSGPVGYQFGLSLNFTDDGYFSDAEMTYSYYSYYNYINFPSNYMKVTSFSIDKVSKTVKLKFAGEIYVDNMDPNSESKAIEGDITATYEEIEGIPDTVPYHQISYQGVPQYCLAKLNGNPWKARFEYSKSSFTSTDPYKIEINFADSPNPGSYNFDENSTSNYIKFSKFNPLTLSYDYYKVTGQVAYSYREFHGGTNYSFIGTFNFTAVNMQNPQDIIQVTDGEFRSYQQF